MTHSLRSISVAIIVLTSSVMLHHALSITLIEGGQVRGAIVVPVGSAKDVRDVAMKLQRWLHEISDVEVPIVESIAGREGIWLGLAKDYPKIATRYELDELGWEGFIIKCIGERVFIIANTTLGLRHAIYALLEAIGCRWFFPDSAWTVIPKRRTVHVDVDMREKPAFDYRRIWYEWGARTKKLRDDYIAWMERNRQYGHFQISCGHAYESFVPSRLFGNHPEYFALVDGVRKAAQICVSNPEVIQLGIDYAVNAFQRNPERNMVSVEPNDGGGYCDCERCRAIGTISDRTFFYANQIARALQNRCPGKWVGLYAYAYHSEPPRFRLEPNVYVQVTTGFRYTKLTFEEQVNAFWKLGAKVGVYDYFSVYPWCWDMPGVAKASHVYKLAKDIRRYHELGLTTYDAESECNWVPCGLGYWMAAHFMWNPELDDDELVADFCKKAFKRAAKPMRRIIDRWARGERFSQRTLALSLRDLQEAYRLESDEKVRKRLDHFAMYLHWLRLWHRYHHLSQRTEFGKLIVEPKLVIEAAREWTIFTRRVYDTGIVHVYPILFTGWFKRRLNSLFQIRGLNPKMVNSWKHERTDIPTPDEVKRLLANDAMAFANVHAVEIAWKQYSTDLVPLVKYIPQINEKYATVKRSPLFVEHGMHYFIARAGEVFELKLQPQSGHRIKGHWVVRDARTGAVIAEGDAKCEERNEPAIIKFTAPHYGVYYLDPGTGYWRVAQVCFPERPLVVRADREQPLQLWTPRINQPLYFFVPKGTKSFVIGVLRGGYPKTRIVIRDGDGNVIIDKQVLPTDEISITVPEGKDGQVWSIGFHTLRGAFEFYDVPPYLARHPSELLIPKEVMMPKD